MTRFARSRTVAASLAAAATLFIAGCADTPLEPPPAPGIGTPLASTGVPTGRGVVVFRDTAAVPAAGLDLITALGGSVGTSFDDIGVVFVSGLSVDALAQLAASDLVQAVGLDRVQNFLPGVRIGGAIDATGVALGPTADPWNASYYRDGRQWGPRIIQAETAWRAGILGTPQTRVAILDTGIDYDNRDLVGRVDLAASRSFSELIVAAEGIGVTLPVEPQQPGDAPYMDNHFHGTHVASTVTSNNISVAGVAPGATLIAVKVLNFLGSGTFESVASGIRYAAGEAGADVINMSLGAMVDANEPGADALFELMKRTIRSAEKQGTIVISAAGNDTTNLDVGSIISTPCEHSTICVSATGPLYQENFDQPATYTNYGITAIEVAAPGGNDDNGNNPVEDYIIGACSRRTTQPGLSPCRLSTQGVAYFYAWAAGTSMATPHVAGQAALIKSANPTLSVNGLRQKILSTADDVGVKGRDIYSNWGRINVWQSLGGQ